MAWRIGSALLSLVAAGAAVTACTTPSSPSTPSETVPSSSSPSGAARGATPPASPPVAGATSSPTFFSPTDPSSFSMTGRIEVAPALQDPFSNLLMRAALHDRTITLDVVGVPDYPVPPGTPGTLLFGTCKCTLRGQGMHLTVEDGSAITAAGGGAVRLQGTFRPVQTQADAFTLQRP